MTEQQIREYIREQFDDFINDSNPAGEYREKYYSEDAIYEPLGAIEEAFNELIDYHVKETKKLILNDDDEVTNLEVITMKDLEAFDFDAIFQG